eukprot:g12781.t1
MELRASLELKGLHRDAIQDPLFTGRTLTPFEKKKQEEAKMKEAKEKEKQREKDKDKERQERDKERLKKEKEKEGDRDKEKELCLMDSLRCFGVPALPAPGRRAGD